ncbi:hypothetical protein ACF3M1_10810 [Luteimonas sp. WGS1318]|uniref:hypothetical protein n=1 Tax=Luteimonas sp. WGS1318 TaxID=3366815 RepID=UPI00372D0088
MSICNVAITPGKILVAVDTAVAGCRIGDAPTTGHMQKAVIVGDTVIASRGGISNLYFAAFQAMSIETYLDIDVLAASLPVLLARAHTQTLQARAHAGGVANSHAEGCEMTVAGWSPQTGQPRALIATMTPDGRCMVEQIHSTCAGPDFPGGSSADLSTPGAMLTAARAQVEAFAKVDPNAPIGGELVLYELMQGGVIVRKMGAI